MKKIKYFLTMAVLVSLIAGAGGLAAVKTAESATQGTATTTPPMTKKKINLECLKSAVEARETAIITAEDALHVCIKAALETRKSALVAAWGSSTAKARNAGRKSAWNNYRADRKKCQKTYRNAVSLVWKNFHVAGKKCNFSTKGLEAEWLDKIIEDIDKNK